MKSFKNYILAYTQSLTTTPTVGLFSFFFCFSFISVFNRVVFPRPPYPTTISFIR